MTDCADVTPVMFTPLESWVTVKEEETMLPKLAGTLRKSKESNADVPNACFAMNVCMVNLFCTHGQRIKVVCGSRR